MIVFANDTDDKCFRNAMEFFRLHWDLLSKILPEIQDELVARDSNLIVTSLWRDNSKDHREYRAVDLRVWQLKEGDRLDIERIIQDKFPLPSDERPTIKYYHPDNSPFPAHFHVRIPAV
jgi:hypothetical protein